MSKIPKIPVQIDRRIGYYSNMGYFFSLSSTSKHHCDIDETPDTVEKVDLIILLHQQQGKPEENYCSRLCISSE